MNQDERLSNIRRQWNRRAATFPKRLGEDGRELLDFLQETVGFEDATLLDIGCGTGRYMAEFLRRGGRYAAGIEISENMIVEGERMFEALGFTAEDYRFIHAPWEAVDPDTEDLREAADLVLAINTPALDSDANIEKMLACAQRALCLVTFIDRTDLFYQKIHARYHGKEKDFKTSKARELEAFFETRGLPYRYDVVDSVRRESETIDSVLPRYAHWLFHDAGTPRERRDLRRVLEELSDDGVTVRYEFISRKARLLHFKNPTH